MQKARTIKINIIFVIVVAFLFALILGKLIYVALSNNVDGIDLTAFAESRNTKKETIVAQRGTIYDASGEILAQDVTSYTVIAYLEESRTTDPNHPYHVVDKEHTASLLAPLLNMKESTLLNLFNSDAYQVELGPGGREITELLKDQIKELELPGISFIKSVKRYYPKSDFASYTIGYAKTEENGNIVGELGVELEYNDILTGTNGYKEYQQDMYGYQIANTTPIEVPSEDGVDIYLTLDTNIQMFTEQAITTLENTGVEWATISVTNAKTGEILGVSSTPSFDPNIKNISSYYDPFISYEYEPGSVMKIFSFLASMENGLYNGNETYMSGTIQVDDVKIKDWNNVGWGTITFNQGFMGSSNVAATKLAQKLGKEKLFDFYTTLGFGQKTEITLPNEQSGVINFKYNSEIASAAFGQGISVTQIQMIRALTSIANDGVALNPYIVKKIVNSSTNELVYEGVTSEYKKVASKENIGYLKDLMRGVVDGRERMSTGKSYYIDGYDIIGKTGTAQIASSSGGYLTGPIDYIRSFAGLFPGDDPEIIVYVVASKLKNSSSMPSAVKTLIEDTASYLNIYNTSPDENKINIKLESYKNKNIDEVTSELNAYSINSITIGDGNKIIKQYPNSGSIVNAQDKVFLLTNSTNYTMPNMKFWSRSEADTFANLTGIKFNFINYGYVTSTSKKEGEAISAGEVIEVNLSPKYETLEETIDNDS